MFLPSHPTQALIFDMDGTMIDSMPHHAQSWMVLARKHHIEIDLQDMMQRTTGRTGLECVRILFNQPAMDEVTGWAMVQEKEQLYRDTFEPLFAEVKGFKAFANHARSLGLKIGVGTAGDIHNVNFALGHLKMEWPPQVIARGDEGFPGKPEPAIFLEAARRLNVLPSACIVFEDAPLGIEAARRAGMRAVAICTGHSATELAGSHVLAAVADYTELLESNFLEKLNVASA